MPSVTVTRKDGTSQRFEERGRAGGSYSISVTFEGVFAVITDEWGRRVAIPASDIKEVVQDAPQRGW